MRQSITISNAPRARVPAFPPRYFNPGELDVLVALFASVNPRSVIEFGCNEGRAAATLMLNIPSIEGYIGIDVEPGYRTIMPVQRKEIPTEPGKYVRMDERFILVVKPQGSFDLLPTDLPRADAIFIDADHSARGVMQDTTLAMLAINPGGIIVWHDDNRLPQVQVSETLDKLDTIDDAPIVHVEGTWLAFRRIPAARE